VSDDSVPLVADVTMRITAAGDFVGLDLTGADGRVRSVALPSALIAKLTAGFLWAAEEAARRGAVIALSDAAIGHLQSAAPSASAVEIVGRPGAPVLDFEIGGAHMCVRLSREGMVGLAGAMERWFDEQGGSSRRS